MFDDDQIPLISWLNIMKTNIKYNTLRLQKIIYPLWKSSEVTISLYFRQETKTSVNFSLDAIIFSTAQFKILDNFIFSELMFAFKCSFFNNGTLTS